MRTNLLNSKCTAQAIGAVIYHCYYLLVHQQGELKVLLLPELAEIVEGVSWEVGRTLMINPRYSFYWILSYLTYSGASETIQVAA